MNIQLTESEIELGKAISANIQALQHSLMALAMTERMYIEQLRQAHGLGDQFSILHWENGFEEVGDGE